MSDTLSLAALADGTILSPFTRLRHLLDGVTPGHERTIDLTLGEPRETMPSFVTAKIAEAEALFAKYPPIRGSDELRGAIGDWIGRRYNLAGVVDPASEILPCNGSREGLFYAAFAAVGRKAGAGRPAVLMCNPFYQAYLGGALASGAEPVFLDATEATGHLPDLDALEADTQLLSRTAALYLCSPANPQGAVASQAYIARALALARAYDFLLFFDECYSEIYSGAPPAGGLEVAAKTLERFRNIVVFNSLSKRSNLPGLRCGFAAGDEKFISAYAELRNVSAPQVPEPLQEVAIAAYSDEYHVEDTRKLYREKFDLADKLLSKRFNHKRPEGGFFLWLDVTEFGDDESAAKMLFRDAGLRVVPGSYLARTGSDGKNPGAGYIRVALVDDIKITEQALQRLASFRK